MAKKKQPTQAPSKAELKKAAQKLVADIVEEDKARKERVNRMLGRPTKYDKKYCRELIEYFLYHEPYKTTMTMFGPKEVPNDLPTLAGFAMKIGVCRDTLNEWSEGEHKDGKLKHPEFSDAIKKAKTIQEHYLVTNGLRGNYDRTFAIFFAKNNLPYKDESVVEHKGLSYDELERPDARAQSVEEARKQAQRQS